jgi:hypothetical protein
MLWWRPILEWARSDRFVHPREDAWPDYFDNTRDVRNGPGKDSGRYAPSVTTIVLHQTAVKFGTTKRNRDKYGERLALHRRFYKVPYHCVALLNGDVLWNNEIDRYTYHGNSSNARSLGVAVEGSFPGLESKRKPKHHAIDDFLIATARAAVKLMLLKAEEAGANVTHIQAHRNYSSGRVGDPGERLWREVALRAGLVVDGELAAGGGRPIPTEWQAGALYDYRGRRLR